MNTHAPTDKNSSNVSDAPFALPELLERCMGNAAVAALILDKFETQLQHDLAQMQKQYADGDAAQLTRTAHALKGAAGVAAASALHALAAEIEIMGRENRLDTIARGLASLRAEVDRCLDHLPVARNALALAASGPPAGAETML